MSKYYELKTNIPSNILEHTEYVEEELFKNLNYDQIQTILDYPTDQIKPAHEGGGVLATDLTIAGVETTVVLSMDLKNKLENYLKNGGATLDQKGLFTGGTQNNIKPDKTNTVRWPSDTIHEDTDYVFFQFGKYQPPFAKDVAQLRKDTGWSQYVEGLTREGLQDDQYRDELIENTTTAATYELYRASEQLELYDYNIMLPMPQDLSNEFQAQWQGKQFTATGRAAVAALGAGNFSFANEVVKNIAGNAKALQTALNTAVLNSIPGVGGNISFNDVSGSTRGIVINPNAELLYDSPEMREIGMIFKLVAKNQDESDTIRSIVELFRAASMPRWGARGGQLGLLDGSDKTSVKDENNRRFDIGGEDNWIRVPDLCKFTFMKGHKPHPYLIQFKPCAISAVEVNYTPDGTYATYNSGAPVAVELRLNFMETKLIYADEVGLGY